MITLAQEFEARGEARAVARMAALAQEAEERGEARAIARMVTLAQEAEARGEVRAMYQAVELVLSTRFGPLPSSVRQALETADLPTLQNWLQRAAQAATLEEVGILPASS